MAGEEHGHTKGLYLQSALDFVAVHRGADVARELQNTVGLAATIGATRTYSKLQFHQLLVRGAALCFPGGDENEAIRRFGGAAYRTFAKSIIGKVGLRLAPPEPHELGKSIVRMHNASTSSSKVEARPSASGFRLHYEGCAHARYHFGLMEAGFANQPVVVTLEILHHKVGAEGVPAADCSFDIVVTSRPT